MKLAIRLEPNLGLVHASQTYPPLIGDCWCSIHQRMFWVWVTTCCPYSFATN